MGTGQEMCVNVIIYEPSVWSGLVWSLATLFSSTMDGNGDGHGHGDEGERKGEQRGLTDTDTFHLFPFPPLRWIAMFLSIIYAVWEGGTLLNHASC